MALGRERTSQEYKETLESCQRAAQRMRKLIESLLELARLDAGQEQMKRMPFDLASVTKESVDLVQPLATTKNISLVSELPTLPLEGDPERIGQVITNLVTNAIHYNKQDGSVTISGNVLEREIELIVRDTGIGISAEDLPRVFERFYRADKSRTGRVGRTGLGLAISKAIVEAHSGTLSVQSTPGEGTAFVLRLPKA
jgi:signal transduction histidine kinase